jgi:hypothetical protein
MRRYLSVAVGLGLLLIVLSFTNAGPALAQTFKPVMSFIVNDSANPVPVTGTVIVRDANAPELQPFRALVRHGFPTANVQTLITTVPAGKRLVIEHLSWTAFAPTGEQVIFASLRLGQFGPSAMFLQLNPPHISASSSFTLQDGSQSVRLYFDPGQEVWSSISAMSNNGEIQLTVSGHLFNLP